MADTSATSTLVTLLPVVVGGVIALAGGLGGHWLSQGMQVKAESSGDVQRSSRS